MPREGLDRFSRCHYQREAAFLRFFSRKGLLTTFEEPI
jgi:hypothetical protein